MALAPLSQRPEASGLHKTKPRRTGGRGRSTVLLRGRNVTSIGHRIREPILVKEEGKPTCGGGGAAGRWQSGQDDEAQTEKGRKRRKEKKIGVWETLTPDTGKPCPSTPSPTGEMAARLSPTGPASAFPRESTEKCGFKADPTWKAAGPRLRKGQSSDLFRDNRMIFR